MPSRKRAVVAPSNVAARSSRPSSKIPETFRFPLVVIFSLALSSVLYSVQSNFTAGDLSSVSRSHDDWWTVIGLIAWKTAELAVGWWEGYDHVDIGSLTLLSHAPYLYLLTTFYGIRPTTAISCLAIDILTTYLPFRLLRKASATHISYPPDVVVFNRSVINDFAIRTYTSLLGAAIYGVIVFGSFGSWLPVYLVVHFDGIKDITAAHNDILPKLITLALPVGYAVREFIFTPAIGARPDSRDSKTASFNPETASLGETIEWNLWGYSKRTRILIKRTATLVAISGLHTWLQTYVAVQGTEFYGAAGWSGVWAVAAVVTGAAYWWVGDVDGISS